VEEEGVGIWIRGIFEGSVSDLRRKQTRVRQICIPNVGLSPVLNCRLCIKRLLWPSSILLPWVFFLNQNCYRTTYTIFLILECDQEIRWFHGTRRCKERYKSQLLEPITRELSPDPSTEIEFHVTFVFKLNLQTHVFYSGSQLKLLSTYYFRYI